VSVIATVISGTIGVTMAFNGFGVWSLVVQSLSSNFFRTELLWVFNNWRPSLIFSFVSLQSMFAFGSRLLASGLLDTVFQNIYLVVIGKLFSPASLGFYPRAKGLQQLSVSNISGIVSRVTFPVFLTVQNDKPRLKRSDSPSLPHTHSLLCAHQEACDCRGEYGNSPRCYHRGRGSYWSKLDR
jgi:O-antigen/teichoic acid export membrane protein